MARNSLRLKLRAGLMELIGLAQAANYEFKTLEVGQGDIGRLISLYSEKGTPLMVYIDDWGVSFCVYV